MENNKAVQLTPVTDDFLYQNLKPSVDKEVIIVNGKDGKDGNCIVDVQAEEHSEQELKFKFKDNNEQVFETVVPARKGDKGEAGVTGKQGLQGPTGKTGEQGPVGKKGDKGDSITNVIVEDEYIKVFVGDDDVITAGPLAINQTVNRIDVADLTPEEVARITGPRGIKGEKGDAGEKGDKGEKGDRGERGLTGPEGKQGIQGNQGLPGDKGDTGAKGDRGDVGPQGKTGDKGDVGPKGNDGRDGTMTFADLTPEQKASLKGDTGDKGDKGDMGPKGNDGRDGADSTVPGPKGDKGDRGEKGDTGPAGSPGKDGADGSSNSIQYIKLTNETGVTPLKTVGMYYVQEDQRFEYKEDMNVIGSNAPMSDIIYKTVDYGSGPMAEPVGRFAPVQEEESGGDFINTLDLYHNVVLTSAFAEAGTYFVVSDTRENKSASHYPWDETKSDMTNLMFTVGSAGEVAFLGRVCSTSESSTSGSSPSIGVWPYKCEGRVSIFKQQYASTDNVPYVRSYIRGRIPEIIKSSSTAVTYIGVIDKQWFLEDDRINDHTWVCLQFYDRWVNHKLNAIYAGGVSMPQPYRKTRGRSNYESGSILAFNIRKNILVWGAGESYNAGGNKPATVVQNAFDDNGRFAYTISRSGSSSITQPIAPSLTTVTRTSTNAEILKHDDAPEYIYMSSKSGSRFPDLFINGYNKYDINGDDLAFGMSAF